MRLKTICLYVCVAITQLFSQTGNLLGVVSDANGSFPLPGANVYLEGTNFGGITDSGGKVYLSNLPSGKSTFLQLGHRFTAATAPGEA